MAINERFEQLVLETDLNSPAPENEPARQAWFLARARMITQKRIKEEGRPLTFRVETFGCQMNARDSEKIIGILESAGFTEAESEDADFLIYNTCTVRDNADQRVFGRLGRAGHLKKNRPGMKIAVCGCMVQEKSNVEKIRKSYRFVDLVFGTHNLYRFAEYLCSCLESDGMVVEIWDRADRIVEALPVARKYPFKSGTNITFGCNNFCSYCIVPYVRGRERSRTPVEILSECERLVSDGVVEIMLLGQNVNSYGKDLDTPCTFAELLTEVCKIEGLQRIRFMTPHPKDLSDEVIEVVRSNEKIARHIHLPLQSGSDRILARMNRHYSEESSESMYMTDLPWRRRSATGSRMYQSPQISSSDSPERTTAISMIPSTSYAASALTTPLLLSIRNAPVPLRPKCPIRFPTRKKTVCLTVS